MLKRKLLMTVLPLLTAGVIVGSGFSAWVFDNEGKTDDTQTGSVLITDVDNNDTSITFNKINGLELVLDQGGYDKLTDKDVGTYFRDSGSSNVNSLTGSAVVDRSGATYNFKITVVIDPNLNGWLEVDGTKDLLTYKDQTAKFTETGTDSGVYVAQVADTAANATFELDLENLINYTIKPTAQTGPDSWNTLNTAVGEASSTEAIKITAEVVNA